MSQCSTRKHQIILLILPPLTMGTDTCFHHSAYPLFNRLESYPYITPLLYHFICHDFPSYTSKLFASKQCVLSLVLVNCNTELELITHPISLCSVAPTPPDLAPNQHQPLSPLTRDISGSPYFRWTKSAFSSVLIYFMLPTQNRSCLMIL